jgi:hypothetical protein
VSLSFELSRSGLIVLTKAEAKVEETYTVELPPPKKSTKQSSNNETNSTFGENETNTTESEAAPV